MPICLARHDNGFGSDALAEELKVRAQEVELLLQIVSAEIVPGRAVVGLVFQLLMNSSLCYCQLRFRCCQFGLRCCKLSTCCC